MTDAAPPPPSDGEPPDAATPASEPGDEGFSTVDALAGAAVAYQAPLVSAVAASAMLRGESSPERRRQLTLFRKAALMWWGLGIAVAVIVLIVIVSVWSAAGDSCRGGPDKLDALGTTYRSSDGEHWTATYQCRDGGSTTMPIPKARVPGANG